MSEIIDAIMADELGVGFIGGGNMARAIADRLIKSNSVKPGNITASAVTQETLKLYMKQTIYNSVGLEHRIGIREVTGSNSLEVPTLSGFSTQLQKIPSTTARIIAYLITTLIKQ